MKKIDEIIFSFWYFFCLSSNFYSIQDFLTPYCSAIFLILLLKLLLYYFFYLLSLFQNLVFRGFLQNKANIQELNEKADIYYFYEF